MFHIETPLTPNKIRDLKVGDEVLLNGSIYTARDQAHKRIEFAILKKRKVPFPLEQQIIYYCGPTPTPPNKIIGSCGPTTSLRMDKYTPLLLKNGLKGMIGKGKRGEEVVEAIKKYKAVYFVALGGCGALLSTFVEEKEFVAYRELSVEAVWRLGVKNFPAIVAIDCCGRSIWSNNEKRTAF